LSISLPLTPPLYKLLTTHRLMPQLGIDRKHTMCKCTRRGTVRRHSSMQKTVCHTSYCSII